MAKSQKILYLITKSNWGGAQRYVYDLATRVPLKALVALGGDGELKQKLEQAGIKTVSIPHLGRDIKIWDELLVFWEIFKILRQEKPDIVHLNSPKAGGLGATAVWLLNLLKAKKLKAVYTAHGWPFAEDRPTWQKLAIKFFSWLTIMFCHQVIVIARSEYDKVKNWPLVHSKLHLVYNGASEPQFLPRSEAREKLGLEQNEFVVGTIAELHKNKGLNYLTEKVVVIGEGEERKKLETGPLILLGQREQAAQYLKAFDVFVLPSIKEGLPYVIMEAGLAGLPVIATRVGGIPEIITPNESGILVAPKDSLALAAATQDLRNNPEKRRRLGQNLRVTIQTKFSPTAMIERTLFVYNRQPMKKGFTLIELLVVIAIISLLSSIVFGSVNQARAKARDSKRAQDLVQLRNALELYREQNGVYPPDPIPDGATVRGYSCWECSTLPPPPCNITGDPVSTDCERLLALAPYLNPRPSDPNLPSSGEFPGAQDGYWYKVEPGGNDYKLVIANTIENFNNIPLVLQDTTWGGGNNDASVYSSERSRQWTFACTFSPSNTCNP